MKSNLTVLEMCLINEEEKKERVVFTYKMKEKKKNFFFLSIFMLK